MGLDGHESGGLEVDTCRGVWTMVACLIQDHASEAPAVAEGRLKAVLARDAACEEAVLWEQVLGAAREFFRAEPLVGERLH
jgi:hypothetical protein